MKHEFILADVNVPRPSMATLNCELRIWDGDDTTAPVDLSVSISQQTKTYVEGKTTAELLDRIRTELIASAQNIINNRKAENLIKGKAALANLITDVDGTLVS